MAASSKDRPVTVGALPHERVADAALVLAAAFAGNPLHLALFGGDVRRRNERFFLDRLRTAPGPWLVACRDDEIVGVIHWQVDDDLDPPRVTLGPLGVRPDVQRQGIGGRLMEAYCADVDAGGRAGYLETDQVDNLPFYRRFQFEAVGEFTVGGVAQYVMWRPALL